VVPVTGETGESILANLDTLSRVLLLFGFVGINIAITVAYLNPATGYELSIYAETPLSFWILGSFALLVSVIVVFSSATRRVRESGLLLGGLSMVSIVLLPIIRGYHYFGMSDSLSHLGTARDMNAGLMPVTESRYPVVHILGSVLRDVTGLALHHAMLIVVVVFVVCFFVSVPLAVRELTDDSWTTYVGFFSGLLLLPINQLSPSLYIHPTSQAIMYAPAFLLVFFMLYKQRIPRNSVLFVLIAPMFVLLHPQQAANLVLFFGVIAVVQIGHDYRYRDRLRRRKEWVLPEVTFFAIVFWLWVRNLDTFWSSLENVYMIPFQETQAAESTVTRGVSLAEVGGSLPEVFAKLFFVSVVYAVLTGIFIVLVLWSVGAVTSRLPHDTVATDGGVDRVLFSAVSGGIVVLLIMFIAFLVGGISDQYFRHLGTLMILGTVIGAVIIVRAMQYVSHKRSEITARRSVAVVLILFLALSIPVVFASPYMYYSSDQVTEMQMSGYETTFEHRDGSIGFNNIRSSTHRYGNAIQGRDIPREAYYPERGSGVPDHFAFQSLQTYYDEQVYIPVPEADRVRDPILWKGFRFSHEDFEYLDSDPGINKVQTNGGYDLYLVEPRT